MRIAIAVIAAACGCTTGYTASDYFDELGAVQCNRMKDCCTPSEYGDWWTADSSGTTYSCVSMWQNPPDRYAIEKALDTGRIHFDPAQAHICVDALRQQACAMFEPAMRYRETYCESPFHGTVADGETCTTDFECVSTSCVIAPGTSSGRCMQRLPSGAACSYDGQECTGADRCQLASDGESSACGLGQPAGYACRSDDECVDHWCKGVGLFTPGHCIRACDGQ